jgi:uncharacterized protein (DUF2147 family)
MSKRRKKNRHTRNVRSLAAKPKSRSLAVVFLTVAIILSLGFWWWKFKSVDMPPPAKPMPEASSANPAAAETKPEFEKLKGRWRRPDGGYILEIKSIADSGAMDAAYFNPKSIHVARAEASREGGAKVFIELRDVNYPGSTYALTYEPASDQLKGIYYQAVEGQRFQVTFVRVK